MTPDRKRVLRRALIGLSVIWAVAALLAVAAYADPADKAAPGRGVVDPKPFLAFATEDGDLVEVNVGGPLLKSLAGSVDKKDRSAASVIGRLEKISAVVVGIEPGRHDEAMRLIETTADGLLRAGWEEVARVREKGERIRVLALSEGDHIVGLVVMLVDRDHREGKTELVFANIAGPFNLADLSKLGDNVDIPGLKDLGEAKRGTAGRDKPAPKSAPREERP